MFIKIGTGEDIQVDPKRFQPICGFDAEGNPVALSLDGSGGLKVEVDGAPALGQATMAGSSPVVLASDQQVPVYSPGGFAISSFTRPANTTGYTAGDNISNNTSAGSAFVFSGLLARNGGSAIVTDAILSIDATATTSGMTGFTAFFFNVAKTRDDNAAASLSYSDMDSYLGRIAFSPPVDQGAVLVTGVYSANLHLVGASGADDIYVILVTEGAWTPTSGLGFKLALKTLP